IAKAEPTIKPKKKDKIAKVEEPKQEEFKPKKTNQDNEAPVIEIAEAITVDSQAYTLKGKVKDKSQIYLTIDGRQVDVKKGKFEFPGFVIDPSEGEVLKIVAIDRWQNKSEKTINIKVEFKQTANARSYEKPNPNNIRTKTDNDKIGIIIGIEKYQALSNLDAPYANRDANAFRAYATRALGIPNKNLKVLIDNEANRSGLLKTLKIWLPQMTRGKSKDIYIFFAGHGLASDDGKDLHILPQDGDPILLEETALSRVQMFDLINKVSPKSVTMFFDTCYSGQTRDERMLVAGLRPVRIVADEQDTPNNFTIFTASNYDQTSGSINEAEHGIFSYYLMKGLEGNADANKDKKLTNGELIAYLKSNVSQEAFTQNRSQEPMLAGDPDKVLMSYR
ncbi:caspase family protein, partial [Candidatus Pelagibacter sp.]|nr:caspase family protein [Candidatus Pelagibacter sp.]